MRALDNHIQLACRVYCAEVAKYFQSPVFSYTGPIHPQFLPQFIEEIEKIVDGLDSSDLAEKSRLIFVLTTPGGVVEAVEKMAEVIRAHFQEIYFIVPQSAMSAGTILCMAGDKIYMDYTSSLGPIDPQVQTPDGILVPALGYLDKVSELVRKSQVAQLSDAEVLMLQRLDLATLRRYEQARDLSISLLKEWLVKFKFKDWTHHLSTNPGAVVTAAEKATRAEEIAKALSDNNFWHSHGRMISMERLRSELRLKIEDYTAEHKLRYNVRAYAQLQSEFLEKQQLMVLMHSCTCSET